MVYLACFVLAGLALIAVARVADVCTDHGGVCHNTVVPSLMQKQTALKRSHGETNVAHKADPPVEREGEHSEDVDAWFTHSWNEKVETPPLLLDIDSKWGVTAPAEIYPTAEFAMMARNPMVTLSETRAVVCYFDYVKPSPAEWGTCNVLAIGKGDIVTEKGPDFAPQFANRQAASMNLWKLSETRVAACFAAPEENYWEGIKGMCKMLSVADMTISHYGETFHLADNAVMINLQPLPGGVDKAVVCYGIYAQAIGANNDRELRTYCKIISVDVESGGFVAGDAIQVNDGDTKGYGRLSVLSENTAVVCIDDGNDNSTRGHREPLHGRGASGFCVRLAINGGTLGLVNTGQLQIATAEIKIDALVAVTDTKAVLCISRNAINDWGICSVLSVPVDGDMELGLQLRPETCAAGKSICPWMELLPMDGMKVLSCYSTYKKKKKCVELSVGGGDELSMGDPFDVVSKSAFIDYFRMVPFGTGKALACFGSSVTPNSDTAGVCAVVDPALTGPATWLAADIIVHTAAPTPAPTPAPAPGTTQVSATWTVQGEGCVLGDDDCVSSETNGNVYESNKYCTITPKTEVGITFYDGFATENGFDKLHVKGKDYQGNTKPDDIQLGTEDTILWSSDSSVAAAGWKFCVADHAK